MENCRQHFITCLKCFVLCCFLFGSMGMLNAQKISVDNNNPRRDMTGEIVDAHDGRVIQFGKKFYWYGTRYGSTNGFTEANTYVCYSSGNLENWKYEGELLPEKPAGVYYRPHVVYNSQTNKYILWYNWYPKLWNGQFGVAESTSPTGPFTIINNNAIVRHSDKGVGDLGVFVDDDGKAYLSYNTIQGHQVSVEQLNEDYTASTLQGSAFIAQDCEAGSMFKRNGLYYLMTDYTCCFCTQGSGARVYTATQPTGAYTLRQNINRYPGMAAPLLQDGNIHDNIFEVLEPGQEHGLEIWLNKTSAISKLDIYQFTGNRSGQCGEVNNPVVHQPILEHGFTLRSWKEGGWQEIATPAPVVTQSSMEIKYQYSFSRIKTDKIKINPLYADTTQLLHLSEIKIPGSKIAYQIFKTGKQEGQPILPAQQAYVMEMNTGKGKQYIWMGDLWGSASDNIKGHDYQFWSAPLKFYSNGMMEPLKWEEKWGLKIKR